MTSFVILLISFATSCTANLLSIQPKTRADLVELQRLSRSPKHDFISLPRTLNASALVKAQGKIRLDELVHSLKKREINWTLVQPTYHGRDAALWYKRNSKKDKTAFHDNYQSYGVIKAYMKYLEHEFIYTTIFELGKTAEKRTIFGLKIAIPHNSGRSIVVECGMHAREWISTSSCLYLMTQYVKKAGGEKLKKRDDLFPYDMYIIPSSNPDGYEFSRNFSSKDPKDKKEHHRWWRKTRRESEKCPSKVIGKQRCDGWKATTTQCIGIDGNRNFPVEFGVGKTSQDPCSETFMGPEPLSEPETQALSKFVYKHRHSIHGFVSVHSYSQLVIHGAGASSQVQYVSKQIARDMTRELANAYTIGTAEDLLYKAGGTSQDFAITCGIPFSYTIELRGPYGDAREFVLGEKEIVPTGQELRAGIERLAQELFAIEMKNTHGPGVQSHAADLDGVKESKPDIFGERPDSDKLRLQ